MRNITSYDEIINKCLQGFNFNASNFVNREINNNNNNNATGRSYNNTITLIHEKKINSNLNKSSCEKAVQTIPELKSPQDNLVDKTKNMEKDHNSLNNFQLKNNVNKPQNSLQTNEDEIMEESISEEPQNLSLSDAQNADKSVAETNSGLDDSQIIQILSHSDRNKAVINRVLSKFRSDTSYVTNKPQPKIKDTCSEITPSTQLDVNKIVDIIRTNFPNVQTTKDKNDRSFSQTDESQKVHGSTQTDAERKDVACPAMNNFCCGLKSFFDEFRNVLLFQLMQYVEIRLRNINVETFSDNGAQASSTENNEKVDNAINVRSRNIANNVSKRRGAGDSDAGNVNNNNNSHHVGTDGYGGQTSNSENDEADILNNNIDKACTVVNPMPRPEPVREGEQTPMMPMPSQFPGNHSVPVRAGRPRSEQHSPRYSPYQNSRHQYWQQSEYNARHRPATHVIQRPNMNGIQLQQNSMIRPLNGWQGPALPNPQSVFPPHHHHHHHF